MQTTYQFEKRTGSPGYVWAVGSNGAHYEIYLQYANVAAIPNKIESKLNMATFKIEERVVEEYPVVELSAEEKSELVAQARAFNSTPAKAETSLAISPAQVEVPANVLALVARYGSSEAAWEDENESACFAMRAYNY